MAYPFLALFAVFSGLLAGLGIATYLLLRPRRDGKPSGNGCATAVAVSALAFFTLCGFGATLAAVGVHELARNGPIERIGVWRDQGQGAPELGWSIDTDPRRPLHLMLEVRGPLAEWIEREHEDFIVWLADQCGLRPRLQTEWAFDAEGELLLRVDLAFPADARDLRRVERAIERHLPQLADAHGLFARLRDAY